MEETVQNNEVNEPKKRAEASQKAMKAILGLAAVTIAIITYGVVLFIDNLQAL